MYISFREEEGASHESIQINNFPIYYPYVWL